MSSADGLTDEQRARAEHRGGHARLIAGPGTGKTLVLTQRAHGLVTHALVPPDEVLVLTFTRAAAAELRTRLRASLGSDAALPRVSTLHSFALRQLVRNAERTRILQPIRIADDYEERWIIEEDIARILAIPVPDVQRFFHALSNDWERLAIDSRDWEATFERQHPRFLGAWHEHRDVFGYTLRSELVYQLKKALEQEDVRIDRPRYLMVDEYQDLNACDQAIIRRLASMGAEVYAAGDDDQSIYGFRFAAPEGIRRFPDDFNGAASLELHVCHRCARRVLAAALFVAKQDTRRLEKTLIPREDAPEGDVRLYRCSDNHQEAQAVADLCHSLVHTQALRPRDILILFRSDRNKTFSKPIRRALEARGLPVRTKTDPLAPLNAPRSAGRQFLGVLRLLGDPMDSLAWRTLLKERANGIGDDTIVRIYEFARARRHSFGRALDDAADAVGARKRALQAEVATIRSLLAALPKATDEGTHVDAVVTRVAEAVISDSTVRETVLSVVRALVRETEVTSLDLLLKALGTSLGDAERDLPGDDAISLMTMHQAKGLTAEAVLIIAVEDEYIPGRVESGDALDDARRLLYVSMTRARRFLYMTFCNRRYGQQQHTGAQVGRSERRLTRFLQDLPDVPVQQWVQTSHA